MLQSSLHWYGEKENGYYRQITPLPKVDLHRHFSGSIRIGTFCELAEEYGFEDNLSDPHIMGKRLTIDSPTQFTKFMYLWRYINKLTSYICKYDRDQIGRLLFEICEDAYRIENIRYLELRLPPFGLTIDNQLNRSLFEEIMSIISKQIQQIESKFPIKINVVLSLSRYYLGRLDPSFRKRYYDILIEESINYLNSPIVGFDLSGREDIYTPSFFSDFFKRSSKEGFNTTIHASEVGKPQHAIEAIDNLSAKRLGHALRTVEDPNVLDKLRKKKIGIEVCLTANRLVGGINQIRRHPIREFYDCGIPITLNTDDPTIFKTNLNKEYTIAIKELGFSFEDLLMFNRNSIKEAFIGNELASKLESTFVKEWSSVLENGNGLASKLESTFVKERSSILENGNGR